MEERKKDRGSIKLNLYIYPMFKKLFFPHDHKTKHIKSLDGLRGIAVLLVVISHGSEMGLNLHPSFNAISHTGNIGVFLFFILSSYLLDRNIALAIVKNRANMMYWKNYILRRVLRIYPLFAISLLIYYVLNRKYLGTFIQNSDDILNHLLLKEGVAFYWSISVEFIYYLISPLILVFCFRFLKWNLKKIAAFLSVLIIFSIIIERHNGYTAFQTVNYLPIFLIGTFIAIVEVFNSCKKKINWDAVGLIAIILIALTSFSTRFWIQDILKELNIRLFLFYGIFAGALLLAVRNSTGCLNKLIEVKFFRFLGAISFSLYLFHWAIILFIIKYGTGIISIDTGFYYLISIFISAISYLIVEYPLSKINIKTFNGKPEKKETIKTELVYQDDKKNE